jgi:two-component system, OmpR family, sensor kinase
MLDGVEHTLGLAAMLDPTTIRINLLTTMLLSLLVWSVIALTQRKIPGLAYLLIGTLCAMTGFGLVGLGDAQSPNWYVLLYGILIQASQAFVTIGFLHLLSIYRYDRFCYLTIAIVALTWGLVLGFVPDGLALRQTISATNETALYVLIIYVLLRFREQTPLVRIIGTLVVGVHLLSNTAAFVLPWFPRLPLPGNLNAWLLYEVNIFLIGSLLFTMLLILTHLWGNLRLANEALNAEIAERVQLQSQLAESFEKEVASRKEQQEMVRLVSHELRTPLAMINRSVEMIRFLDHSAPPQVETRLENIQTASNRLIALVERFLNRSHGTDALMQVGTVRASQLLEALMEHFKSIDSHARLKLPTPVPELTFRCDPDILLTVLINVVGNALKYSPEDSMVELAIAPEGKEIVITIADRGIGIPEADMSQIGTRHFRASNTGEIAGSGTGLFHSLRFLDHLGGALRFHRREGGGTIAEIRLPSDTVNQTELHQTEKGVA